jgi:hypothetical protein
MNNKQLADRLDSLMAIFFLGISAGIVIAVLILIVRWIAK